MNRYDIGRRIEAYRDKLHMSTQELAERIKRSQATISRIENGKQGLTFELLSLIASELRVHPFGLLSDEPLRSSVLHPIGGNGDRGYAPNLLANALHAGRIKRRLRMVSAASLLGISQEELEAVELALTCPDDGLLERMCELYGLVLQHMRALRRFGEEATEIARGLAYLQQLFSHIHHLVRKAADGDEKRVLARIADLLNSADSECPLPPESTSDDVGLFLNRLSLHLVNALKDKDFRGKMFEMAGLNGEPSPAVDTRGN
ncbi:MAG: helix-turn-helix domain-containing protein [Planctomycetaceae bacterium]|nr:helix-turn-helix domain-containing protein [Planctomycetaceae bacterium]